MTTNLYLNHFNQKDEQNLIRSLNEEAIQFYGIDIIYAPRIIAHEDDLLNEDKKSAFLDALSLEVYIKTVDGFEGEGDLIDQFGFETRDEISLIFPRQRFTELTGLPRPREGDLIYFPLTQGIFEIKFVEDERPFYQLGRLYVYDVVAQLFRYSQETIETGFSGFDNIAESFGQNLGVILTESGEEILLPSGDVLLEDGIGNAENDASADVFSDNVTIEEEADNLINFDEKNPFGEIADGDGDI